MAALDDLALSRAVRESADSETARLNDLPITRSVILTVSSTTPLTVTWRSADLLVAGKNAGYTPVIGDRVRCSLVDGQLLIDYAIDGQP